MAKKKSIKKIIDDNRGQWDHPGEITRIHSRNITMKGVPYPVLGIGADGEQKMMYPNQEYTFNQGPVTEYPMMEAKNGGWLNKYQNGSTVPDDDDARWNDIEPLPIVQKAPEIKINQPVEVTPKPVIVAAPSKPEPRPIVALQKPVVQPVVPQPVVQEQVETLPPGITLPEVKIYDNKLKFPFETDNSFKPPYYSLGNPNYKKPETKNSPILKDIENKGIDWNAEIGHALSTVWNNTYGYLEDKVDHAVNIAFNGIMRKIKLFMGNDNDKQIVVSNKPKTVKEYYNGSIGNILNIDIPNSDRSYKQQTLPLNNVTFGYRNRGEYKDIDTEGLEITTFHPFKADNKFKDSQSVIAIDPQGHIHVGKYGEFKNQKGYLFSPTYENKIIDFYDNDVKPADATNPGYVYPKVKVLNDNNKETDGSLSLLMKNTSSRDKYGDVQGGRILVVKNNQVYLLSGTVKHITDEFRKLKGSDPYLQVYSLDNGTYNKGLAYKNKKITAKQLKEYDELNTSGGNGLYIINYGQPVYKYKQEYIDNMPNIRNENDESYKKGHALKNEIKNIILHHTAYTNKQTNGPEVRKQYMTPNEHSSHIVIEEDGTRTIYASPEQVTFHAGESLWNGRSNVNDFGVGVEFQGDTTKKPLTDAQIESFFEYFKDLSTRYGLSLKDIITHQMIAPDRKPDIVESEYKRILDYGKTHGYYKRGGVTYLNEYAQGGDTVPTWQQAWQQANERTTQEDNYIKSLGLDPNTLSPTQRKKALLHYNISPKATPALQTYARETAAKKAAAVQDIAKRFNLPTEVAERSLEYSQAAPSFPGTITKEEIIPTKEEVQYNLSHPIEYFTGRPNNFDLLAGIPGYIVGTAIPNTVYNVTAGLDQTAEDLSTGLQGLAGTLVNDSMSDKELQALNKSLGRFFDATAAASAFIAPEASELSRASQELPTYEIYESRNTPLLNEAIVPTYEPAASPVYKLNAGPENSTLYLNEAVSPIVSEIPKEIPIVEIPKINYDPANSLEIKSIADGSPLEKSLNKKGEINVNSLKAFINNSGTPKVDKHYLNLVLNKYFYDEKNINYNDFRNKVSQELAPLEREVYDSRFNDYGLPNIGYYTGYDRDLRILQARESMYQQSIDAGQDPNNPQMLDLMDEINDLKFRLSQGNEILENKTLLYSGTNGLANIGSDSHFPDRPNTLLHTRYIIDKTTPEIFYNLESQSDFMQKDISNYEANKLDNDVEILNREKKELAKGRESLANEKDPLKYEIRKKVIDGYELALNELADAITVDKRALASAIVNLSMNNDYHQLFHLKDKHLERLLQENVQFANSKGLTKYRYPTPETAAKIQGYRKQDVLDELRYMQDYRTNVGSYTLKDFLEKLEKDNVFDAVLNPNMEDILEAINTGVLKMEDDDMFKDTGKDLLRARIEYLPKKNDIQKLEELLNKGVTSSYKPSHETILKKYNDFPKMVKKIYGIDVTTVTDKKGNTWYEFDIPTALSKSKGKIKAFKYGGWLNEYQDAGSTIPVQMPDGSTQMMTQQQVDALYNEGHIADKGSNGSYIYKNLPQVNINAPRMTQGEYLMKDLNDAGSWIEQSLLNSAPASTVQFKNPNYTSEEAEKVVPMAVIAAAAAAAPFALEAIGPILAEPIVSASLTGAGLYMGANKGIDAYKKYKQGRWYQGSKDLAEAALLAGPGVYRAAEEASPFVKRMLSPKVTNNILPTEKMVSDDVLLEQLNRLYPPKEGLFSNLEIDDFEFKPFSQAWWDEQGMREAANPPHGILTKDDFYTLDELEKYKEFEDKFNHFANNLEDNNMTLAEAREIFAEQNPELTEFAENFLKNKKIVLPEYEAQVWGDEGVRFRHADPPNNTIEEKGGIDAFKTNYLKELNDPNSWLNSGQAKEVLAEMLGFSSEELANLSFEELENMRRELIKNLRTNEELKLQKTLTPDPNWMKKFITTSYGNLTQHRNKYGGPITGPKKLKRSNSFKK